MILKGFVHKFGDHIDTDVIIPTEFVGRSEPDWLARGCFSKVFPGFSDRVKPGDLIFAGENFGCGSSREHAPLAIKATGIACVVAASFGRIFYRSAINIGLPAIVCPQAISHSITGEEAAVNLSAGVVIVAGKKFPFRQFPPQVTAILEGGGLVSLMMERLKIQGKGGEQR